MLHANPISGNSSLNKEEYKLPELNINRGTCEKIEKNNLNTLGLNIKFIDTIQQVLTQLKEKDILSNGMLTILEVNPAGDVLHNAWYEGNYKAILKPMFIKDKSMKESIASPYIDAFSVKDQDNQAENETYIAPIELSYPLEHLNKLIDLEYISLKRLENDFLIVEEKANTISIKIPSIAQNMDEKEFIQAFFPLHLKKLADLNALTIEKKEVMKDKLIININKQAINYKVKLPNSLNTQEPQDVFKIPYFEDNKGNLVGIYYEDDEPLKVLGVKLTKVNQILPVVCDVDAHNCIIKQTDINTTAYDTSREDRVKDLKAAIQKLLTGKLNAEEITEYQNAVNSHMGFITPQEIIIYHTITKACNKPTDELDVLFQHGATGDLPAEVVKAIQKLDPSSDFPAITNKTKIIGIMAQIDPQVLRIRGTHILLTYKYLQDQNFTVLMPQIWEEQYQKLILDVDQTKLGTEQKEVIEKLQPLLCSNQAMQPALILQPVFQQSRNRYILHRGLRGDLSKLININDEDEKYLSQATIDSLNFIFR